MKIQDLNTPIINTWCPGCLNFSILTAMKQTLVELSAEKKVQRQNIVTVSGIGCHAKIYDYLNLNSFYGLHGRVLPVALGIKLANPKLTVIGFGGDGDTYAEGISHFVHLCRYNPDLTMIVHNNQVFALTTGQATPTTEKGFPSKSTPKGEPNNPLNPIALALVSGAGFVSRGSCLEPDHLKKLIKAAILYPGFAFIDVLQPCLTYHDTTDFLKKHSYQLNKDGYEFTQALKLVLEYDYSLNPKSKIPIGIFYQRC